MTLSASSARIADALAEFGVELISAHVVQGDASDDDEPGGPGFGR